MAAGVPGGPPPPLLISLFGPFEARQRGAPLPRLRTRKGEWLLALLVLRGGREIDRAWLAGLLWPESAEPQALANLRNSLKDLRHALGPEAARLRAPEEAKGGSPRTLCLDLSGAVVDVLDFDREIARGSPDALERAIALYRGPLLEGCVEEWVFQERQAREQAYLQALEQLAGAAMASGDLATAERRLRQAVAVDPLRESAQRALMQALAEGGNYAAALLAYRDLRLRLHRDLSAEPDAETTSLFQQLRAEARGKAGAGGQWPGSRALGADASPTALTPDPWPLTPGTLTFLFTDIEGSVRLWEAYPEAMSAALARHDAVLREAIEAHAGHVFKTVGDQFCAVFATAPEAVTAALAAQRAVSVVQVFRRSGVQGDPSRSLNARTPERLKVRMALHTGAAEARDGDYFGAPVNRVARLLDAGHGGQILLSLATQELARDALPEAASWRDLGERRLKDLARPERLFQLVAPDLPQEFPPLRTLDARPHNLPAQLTPLIGREREVETARELLSPASSPHPSRLLTLTGPGGTGKTRLALQVAADRIDAFADGVYFVPLAPISDAALVPRAIAQTLGVRETEGRPLIDSLKEYLREKQMALLLDNFEQVVAAAPVVTELLTACPRLTALVTSREPLHVRGEQELPVPPLAIPGVQAFGRSGIQGESGDNLNAWTPERLNALTQYAAVELFIQRALAVQPEFTVTNENAPAVAEICCRLNGLPLAIELAAARIKLLPPPALLARLAGASLVPDPGGPPRGSPLQMLIGGARDLPARQQTLRATIAWSHDLLNENERLLFRRLAVFVGGCTLEAAEAVGGDVLDELAALVDKSLLRQDEIDGEPRFFMLETIREYAREQLTASGEEAELRRRHAQFFLELAETAEPELQSPEAAVWMARLEREHDNLRAALAWSHESPERNEIGMRLAGALRWFWYVHGHFYEGRAWLESLLIRSHDQEHTVGRARSLTGAGMMAWVQGEYAAARPRMEAGVAHWRELGDQRGLGGALLDLGMMSVFDGHAEAALSLSQESAAIFRDLGNNSGLAKALINRAHAEHARGDHETARALFTESLAIARRIGDKWSMALALKCLGNMAFAQGDPPAARQMLEESLTLWREVGEREELAYNSEDLALVLQESGDFTAAAALLEEALAIARALGQRFGLIRCNQQLGLQARERGDYEKARSCHEQTRAVGQELQNPGIIAWALNDLGYAAYLQGDCRAARPLLEAGLADQRETGNAWRITWSLFHLAELSLAEDDDAAAAALLEESLALSRQRDDRSAIAWGLQIQGRMARHRGDWAAARACFAESLALWRQRGNALRMAECLEGLAAVAVGEEQWERAARLFGAAQARREALGTPLPPVHAPEHERQLAAVCAALGGAAFEAAGAAGRAMSLDQTIEVALLETADG